MRAIRSVQLTSIDTASVISSPTPIFDHLLESSRRDDSNKWSNIGFGEEINPLEIKTHLTVLVLSKLKKINATGPFKVFCNI